MNFIEVAYKIRPEKTKPKKNILLTKLHNKLQDWLEQSPSLDFWENKNKCIFQELS